MRTERKEARVEEEWLGLKNEDVDVPIMLFLGEEIVGIWFGRVSQVVRRTSIGPNVEYDSEGAVLKVTPDTDTTIDGIVMELPIGCYEYPMPETFIPAGGTLEFWVGGGNLHPQPCSRARRFNGAVQEWA